MSDGRYDDPRLNGGDARYRASKVARMAEALLCSAVDLGDERACIGLLQRQGEHAKDIVAFLDAAIEQARERIAKGAAA